MDSKMQQILELITSSLMVSARSKKIGDVIWEHMRSHNVECTNEYNNYTVEQFLVLFKIKYLRYLDVINEETYKSLEKLYLMRIELNRRMGEIAYKDLFDEKKKNQNKIQALYTKVLKIDEILNRYHLLINDNDYEMLFFTSIEKDNYDNIATNEEINNLMREIKR